MLLFIILFTYFIDYACDSVVRVSVVQFQFKENQSVTYMMSSLIRNMKVYDAFMSHIKSAIIEKPPTIIYFQISLRIRKSVKLALKSELS